MMMHRLNMLWPKTPTPSMLTMRTSDSSMALQLTRMELRRKAERLALAGAMDTDTDNFLTNLFSLRLILLYTSAGVLRLAVGFLTIYGHTVRRFQRHEPALGGVGDWWKR